MMNCSSAPVQNNKKRRFPSAIKILFICTLLYIFFLLVGSEDGRDIEKQMVQSAGNSYAFSENFDEICFMAPYARAEALINIKKLSVWDNIRVRCKAGYRFPFGGEHDWWIVTFKNEKLDNIYHMSGYAVRPNIGGVVCKKNKDFKIFIKSSNPNASNSYRFELF